MEFSYKNNEITVISDKKHIILAEKKIVLDGLDIECAGEYEKSGFLLYARESAGIFYYLFRAEDQWIAYIPSIPQEIDAKILDFFGQLDILVAPFAKSEQKFLEQIEPKMLVSFSPQASDLTQIL